MCFKYIVVLFWTFYSLRYEKGKNVSLFPPKYSTLQLFATFIIISQNNKNEWLLKDRVTLKIGAVMLKIQLYITRINYILKYITTEMFFSVSIYFLF